MPPLVRRLHPPAFGNFLNNRRHTSKIPLVAAYAPSTCDIFMPAVARHSCRSPLARTLAALALLIVPMLSYAAPAVFFSDLDSGPNSGGQNNKGVFVSVWGSGFGTVPGTVTVGGGQADNYPVWTDTKVTFQLGPNALTGNIVVRTNAGETSNGVPFTVRAGRIFFVAPDANGSGTF